MKWGLKSVNERSERKPVDGEVVISITNNCRLTKGKKYTLSYSSLFWSVKNDYGHMICDMSLFVYESDWLALQRDLKLRKLGINK
jgi:hypothetical protein